MPATGLSSHRFHPRIVSVRLAGLFVACLALLLLSIAQGRAQEAPISSATIGIAVGIGFIEDQINQNVPWVLQRINKRVICHKKLKIRCDVTGKSRRSGRIRVTGKGSSLRMAIPVNVTVSARGVGSISKRISETVDFSLTAYFKATPTISGDWHPSLNLGTGFTWSKKPEIRLLKIIRLDLTKYIEPVIRSELAKTRKQLRTAFRKFGFRDKAEQVWLHLQDPFVLSEDPGLALVFRPQAVGFSRLAARRKQVRFQFGVTGSAEVTTQTDREDAPPYVPLQPLEKIKRESGGLAVTLPVTLLFADMEREANAALPFELALTEAEHGVDGAFVVHRARIVPTAGPSLAVDVDYTYDNRSDFLTMIDIFDWFDTEGSLTFSGVPQFDDERSILSVGEIDITTESLKNAVDAVITIARLPFVKSRIQNQLEFDLIEEIDGLTTAANSAVNRNLGKDVVLEGVLERIAIGTIDKQEDRLVVPVGTTGSLDIRVGID